MLILMTLLGCLRDNDEDGYAGEVDCNDEDPGIYPGALESCDGIDTNCDGSLDDGAYDALSWHLDADGDGFGEQYSITEACDQPEGHVAGGTFDCDDEQPAAFPGNDELCDSIDNDCDDEIDEDSAVDAPSWYADADGDGFGDDTSATSACAAPAGLIADNTDCIDSNAAVYPGAPEICEDGVINDCDGTVDSAVDACGLAGEVSLAGARALLLGEDSYDEAGSAVASAGDFNGDGLADVIVGAPYHSEDREEDGRAYVVLGGVSGTVELSAAHAVFTGTSGNDLAGWAVAGVGDTDGDGMDDVVIGAPQAGVYLMLGGVEGSLSLSESHARLTGGSYAVAGAGDTNGDGLADFLVGQPSDDEAGSSSGSVYVVLGGVSGGGSISGQAETVWYGADSGEQLGWALQGMGDFDGDGLDDAILGAPYDDDAGVNTGIVYMVSGTAGGEQSIVDAAAVQWLGEGDNDLAGWSVSGAGDVDGDGLDDALIGAPGDDDGGNGAGSVYVVLGSASGGSLSAAYAQLIGSGSAAGSSVADAGDIDGDGSTDLIIGAPEDDTGGSNSGSAYLLMGISSGTAMLSASQVTLLGATGDYAGGAVAGAGDVNGDGLADVIVGAHANGEGGPEAGASYIFLAGGY